VPRIDRCNSGPAFVDTRGVISPWRLNQPSACVSAAPPTRSNKSDRAITRIGVMEHLPPNQMQTTRIDWCDQTHPNRQIGSFVSNFRILQISEKPALPCQITQWAGCSLSPCSEGGLIVTSSGAAGPILRDHGLLDSAFREISVHPSACEPGRYRADRSRSRDRST
jgi:hypothetical protein